MNEHNGKTSIPHHPVIIIGSGPAGYTAAIYAARAELKPLLFSGAQPGGQLMITTEVENFPGYPDGITGPEMMEDLRKQAERFDTKIVYDSVTKADLDATPKRVWLGDGSEYTADAIIISTGATAKYLGLPSEKKFYNLGVSACAVCDGYFYRGQEVAVVGGGDSAAEESMYLAKLCPKVHLFVRRDEMRASRIMANRVLNTPNIEIHWNTEVTEILGDEKVSGVKLINNQTNEASELAITGLFIAIGHKPNTQIFEGQLDMDETGYILTQANTTYTSEAGVFACGDAQDNVYRQAITAAGTGCMAALDAERWLAAQEAAEAAPEHVKV